MWFMERTFVESWMLLRVSEVERRNIEFKKMVVDFYFVGIADSVLYLQCLFFSIGKAIQGLALR